MRPRPAWRTTLLAMILVTGMVPAQASAQDDLLLIMVPQIVAKRPLTGNHATRAANLDPANPTATCLSCHASQAANMGASAHYR